MPNKHNTTNIWQRYDLASKKTKFALVFYRERKYLQAAELIKVMIKRAKKQQICTLLKMMQIPF